MANCGYVRANAKMKISDNNIKTLMLSLHKSIEDYANQVSNQLMIGETTDFLNYPPNCGLTDAEHKALEKLKNDQELRNALRKILADNSASVIFDLMNNIDGTTDPDENFGEWTQICFVDSSEEIEPPDEMLHDNFYATYWDWKEIRPDKGWTLDILDK